MKSLFSIILFGLLLASQQFVDANPKGGKLVSSWQKFDAIMDAGKSNIDSSFLLNCHNEYSETLNGFLEKKSKTSNEVFFLKHLFYKVHRKFLKKYAPYPSFSEIFESGTYSCLSGTALYSMFLSDLGYEFQIIETTYHVFLIMNTAEGKVCFEATDPIYGFIEGEESINEKLKEIERKDRNYNKEGLYKFSQPIQQIISFQNLVGLQYYNQAVMAFNEGKFNLAYAKNSQAFQLHPSERLQEFSLLLKCKIQD